MEKTNSKIWDHLWLNAQIATMEPGKTPYGLIKKGALGALDGKIVWVGEEASLPGSPDKLALQVEDLEGRVVTPGLIDCHTHLVYAGNRSSEFEMRMQGASYESIARAGGGIQSTVKATRAASEEELFSQSLPRAQALAKEGVTTLEIKSGYGLDIETELKILRVAKKIGNKLNLTISLTFLGAHALPLEYKNSPDEYINSICQEMLPRIHQENLVDNVDVFCEKIAFNLEQTERVFLAASQLGLKIKCHAEQLSDLGASLLAARYQAVSVDHLEFLSEEGVAALAASGTVAVLLPSAFYYLRETHKPPVELLRRYQVPIAVSTDCNPGTSPCSSILLVLNMASVLFGLTPEEALLGVTCHAAKALGMSATKGTLSLGKAADLAIWNISHPAELVAQIGINPLFAAIQAH